MNTNISKVIGSMEELLGKFEQASRTEDYIKYDLGGVHSMVKHYHQQITRKVKNGQL